MSDSEATTGPVTEEQVTSTVVELLSAEEESEQLTLTTKLRKFLSVESSPPIQPAIDAGAVPRLVALLNSSNSQLQFEAAWALTNIASGTSEHTNCVVDAGAVPLFVELLQSTVTDIQEQAVWALGNIAGDGADKRQLVTDAGALQHVCTILNEPNCKLSMQRNATWTLSNLFRGKPAPNLSDVIPAVPTVASLLESQDEEVLTDAAWAMSYVSDGVHENIQAVVNVGAVPRLVALLQHTSPAVATPALRTVGNIATGDDSQTQCVIDAGCLNHLRMLLGSSRKGIRKEACWTLSNITAGSTSQIQAVIDENIFPGIMSILGSDAWDIRKEALWALSNATSGGTAEQMAYLVNQGGLGAATAMLEAADSRVVIVALEAIDNILRTEEREKAAEESEAAEPIRVWAAQFEEMGGIDKLEALWSHESQDVYLKAVQILREYWDAEEEGGDMDELGEEMLPDLGEADLDGDLPPLPFGGPEEDVGPEEEVADDLAGLEI